MHDRARVGVRLCESLSPAHYAGPYDADVIGIFDPQARTFHNFSIAASAVAGTASKFVGCATAPTGHIIFAPHDADAIGVFTLGTVYGASGAAYSAAGSSFATIDISRTLTGSSKFWGAATATWPTAAARATHTPHTRPTHARHTHHMHMPAV